MKLIAFEPDAENFKLLRVNSILNNVEDKMTLVNYGLGNRPDELKMYKYPGNPAANTVVKAIGKDKPTETIKIIALDDWLAENKITASSVKYMWIDTEGFEAQVILGAKNLIRQNPVPMFAECNLGHWDESGCFEEMMTLLEEHYTHFILFANGKEIVYPLETLRTIERPNTEMRRIGDIFIFKAGAID